MESAVAFTVETADNGYIIRLHNGTYIFNTKKELIDFINDTIMEAECEQSYIKV